MKIDVTWASDKRSARKTRNRSPKPVTPATSAAATKPELDDQTKNHFIDWLHRHLEEHNLTNRAFAKEIGVNDSLIGHYLRGTRIPTYVTLQKIKDVYDIDMNEVI